MKIEITTDRKPFFEERKLEKGDKLTVDKEVGQAFIDNGFAKEVKTRKKKDA